MILYDKNGTFLGMGQGELSILGYEDMQEFKSCFSDFADLFVNRPGYISKFKNFSWIDYILHSGAPNKNVILKHKNGTEIETKLAISEIPLIQEINGFAILYYIKLDTINDSADLQTKHNAELSTPEKENLTELYEQKSIDNLDNNAQDSYETLPQNHLKEIVEEPKIDDFEEKQIHLNVPDDSLDIPKENDFKLKVNMDDDYQIDIKSESPESAANEISSLSTDEIPIISKEFQEHTSNDSEVETNLNIGIKIDTKEEEIVEENLNLKTEDIPPEEDIDFTQIAEDTGMDLGDIATFISDFIDESKDYLNNLKDNDNNLNIDYARNEAIKLEGVASSLKIKNISHTLNSILKSFDTNEIDNLTKQFQRQIKDLEEQLF